MIVAQKKPKSSRGGRKSDTPDAPPPPVAPDKLPTRMIRAPGDIAEMLLAIEQHGLNGWNTIPKILSDARCPLADWLRPYYEQVIREKLKLNAAIKRQSEQE